SLDRPSPSGTLEGYRVDVMLIVVGRGPLEHNARRGGCPMPTLMLRLMTSATTLMCGGTVSR
ncbi:MAG: hypothetical protein WAL59_24400, partial [Roseiarcus sp.]